MQKTPFKEIPQDNGDPKQIAVNICLKSVDAKFHQ